MRDKLAHLPAYQQRLSELSTGTCPVEQQIDQLLIRAEMNGLDFNLRVLQPWARDPAFTAHSGPNRATPRPMRAPASRP